jgi:GNAT superfamily N-acetyltransferase
MNSSLLFQPAQASDAALLTDMALAGKRHWKYPEDWIELWRYDLTITPAYIAAQPVRMAVWDGTAIGFVGLSTAEGGRHRHLEHLWLRPRCIGCGFGHQLFKEAVRMAREEGTSELRISSDPNAEGFYLKMGAIRIGTESYELPGRILREIPLLLYIVPGETKFPEMAVSPADRIAQSP